MIKIQRTHDMALVKEIYTHPVLYPMQVDDFSPPPSLFIPRDYPQAFYLLPYLNRDMMGVFFLHPHNAVLYQIHVCILPEFWGHAVNKAVFTAHDWMRKNSLCKKLVAIIPENNKPAISLAKRCNYQHQGNLEKSIQIKGKLINQLILGIDLWAESLDK